MIRTITALMIAVAMSFALFGCGGGKPAATQKKAENTVTTPAETEAVTEEAAPEEAAPAEEGAEHPGSAMKTEGSEAK